MVLNLPYFVTCKWYTHRNMSEQSIWYSYIFSTVNLGGAINWRHRSLTCSHQSAICRLPGPPESSLRHLALQLYIHFNITLPLKSRSPKRSLPFRFPHKIPSCFFSHFVSRSLLISSALILSPEQYLARYTNYKSSHCGIFSSVLLSPSLGPSILLCSLFSNTLNIQKNSVSQWMLHVYRIPKFPDDTGREYFPRCWNSAQN